MYTVYSVVANGMDGVESAAGYLDLSPPRNNILYVAGIIFLYVLTPN
jgi:hypothetical protein